jgi:sulfite reductase (NADPH) hemoprotein beta-component
MTTTTCGLNDVSLKYTIDDMGLDEFKRQVEERLGRPLPAPRKHQPFTKNIDDFSGWVKGDDGLYSHTVFIENGMLLKVDNFADFIRQSRRSGRTSSESGIA